MIARVAAAILAIEFSRAIADDKPETWTTLEAFMLCGYDYVGSTSGPTLQGAEAACAKNLDAYGAAMRTVALRAAIGEHRTPEAARAFAARREAEARAEARAAFADNVRRRIAAAR